ncbi:MAG: sigma-70 family RNA polymerase sigma factor [Anaerolineales bacterium]|nr:sigma-70 family RNA polymerase sigma factor [Anaerolineales bacterium]
MDERTAISRMKAGNIGGLEYLVREYQVRAVRTAHLILGDRALAEDVTQSAFIRAYERIDQFDPQRSFGPWFLRSVANDSIKAAQRARRTVSLDVLPASAEGAEPGRPVPEPVDPAAGPLAALERAQSNEAVWSSLERLPPDQRATIVLRYFLGFTDTEIAQELGSTPATTRWRLHAARKRLRALLGSEGTIERPSTITKDTRSTPATPAPCEEVD